MLFPYTTLFRSASGLQAPAIELIVALHFPVVGGITMMEGDPGIAALQAGKAHQEMRFHTMRLNQMRVVGADTGAQLAQAPGIETETLFYRLVGQSSGSQPRNELIGSSRLAAHI